jgi:hypothetical protein
MKNTGDRNAMAKSINRLQWGMYNGFCMADLKGRVKAQSREDVEKHEHMFKFELRSVCGRDNGPQMSMSM